VHWSLNKAVDQNLGQIASTGLEPHDFYAPRRCLREPIAEIFLAAHLLDRAVGAHLAGDREGVLELIRQADMPAVRAFTEMLWGAAENNPEQWRYIRKRPLVNPPAAVPKQHFLKRLEPAAPEKKIVIARDGHNCVFCGMPVIRSEVRAALDKAYPEAKIWGNTNRTQHAAFQCLWLQYDHLLPRSRGGDNSPANVVVACAPCNYGRRELMLDEVGVIDPRTLPVLRTSWDGLERFLTAGS